MKAILVPTDFSKHSEWASHAALSLARKSGATVHFLYVVDVPQYAFSAAHEMWNMAVSYTHLTLPTTPYV